MPSLWLVNVPARFVPSMEEYLIYSSTINYCDISYPV